MPAILHNQHTVASPAVSRCRVYAASVRSQILALNDVSIFCSSEVVSTSGLAAMLTSTVENVSLIVALCQMLLSWRGANFWIWNDVVIAETC